MPNMPEGRKFYDFLFEKDKYLSEKFQQYLHVEYRNGSKVLILNMGAAPEVDIDELISLKDIWEDYSLTDPDVACDPFLISGTIRYSVN